MRILFINENYGLHGGVEQNILDAAKGLRARTPVISPTARPRSAGLRPSTPHSTRPALSLSSAPPMLPFADLSTTRKENDLPR